MSFTLLCFWAWVSACTTDSKVCFHRSDDSERRKNRVKPCGSDDDDDDDVSTYQFRDDLYQNKQASLYYAVIYAAYFGDLMLLSSPAQSCFQNLIMQWPPGKRKKNLENCMLAARTPSGPAALAELTTLPTLRPTSRLGRAEPPPRRPLQSSPQKWKGGVL